MENWIEKNNSNMQSQENLYKFPFKLSAGVVVALTFIWMHVYTAGLSVGSPACDYRVIKNDDNTHCCSWWLVQKLWWGRLDKHTLPPTWCFHRRLPLSFVMLYNSKHTAACRLQACLPTGFLSDHVLKSQLRLTSTTQLNPPWKINATW